MALPNKLLIHVFALQVVFLFSCEKQPLSFETEEAFPELSSLVGRHLLVTRETGFPAVYYDLTADRSAEILLPEVDPARMAVDTLRDLVYIQDNDLRLYRAKAGEWAWEEVGQLSLQIQLGARFNSIGTHLYSISEAGGLARINISTLEKEDILPEGSLQSSGFDIHPLSGEIAYSVGGPGKSTELWLASANGSQRKLIYVPKPLRTNRPQPVPLTPPRWVPNSNTIAFVDQTRGHLFLMDVKTEKLEESTPFVAGFSSMAICVSTDQTQVLLPGFLSFQLATRADTSSPQFTLTGLELMSTLPGNRATPLLQGWWW